MKDFDYQKIDDIIHSRIRLAIMSVLISVDNADFTHIKKLVKTTDGNLSIHLRKLEEANYLTVSKSFKDRKPQTTYKLTKQGIKAFNDYVNKLEELIKK